MVGGTVFGGGGIAAKQIGQGAAAAVAAGGQIQGQLFFGAGQRHIQQAQIFRQRFGFDLLFVVFGKLAVVQQLGAVLLPVVVDDVPVLPLAAAAGAPDEGAVHQRILQAFGSVEGNDFDQIFVAFQPQHRFAVAALPRARGGDAPAEPLVQRCGRVAGFVFGGQQFQQLVQIGQRALSPLRQQPRFDAVAVKKPAQRGIGAVALPFVERCTGGLYPLQQRLFVFLQAADVAFAIIEQTA